MHLQKIGRKGKIGIIIIGIAFIRFLIEQFGESIFGTWYAIHIEPIIKKGIHILIMDTDEKLSKETLEKGFSIDIISLIILVTLVLYVLALLIRWYFIGYKRNREVEKESVKKTIDNLVKDHDYIISAQLYQYSSFVNGTGRNKNRKIDITYYYCKAKENVDINAIIHEHFVFEEQYNRAVSNFSKSINEYDKNGREKNFKQAKDSVGYMLRTFRKEFEYLSIENISEKNCIHYALYKGVQCVLGEETWDEPIPGIKEDICNALRNGKRTGCLPSIMLQSVYVFRNGESMFKSNRTYWSYVVNPCLMPHGLKKALLVLTFAYDQTHDLTDDFLQQQLVHKVNKYFADIKGGITDENNTKRV